MDAEKWQEESKMKLASIVTLPVDRLPTSISIKPPMRLVAQLTIDALSRVTDEPIQTTNAPPFSTEVVLTTSLPSVTVNTDCRSATMQPA
eukprot:1669041-Prymnesium_polylepis.2